MSRRKTLEEIELVDAPQNRTTVVVNGKEIEVQSSGSPRMVSLATDDSPVRRNRAGTIERTDKLTNIDNGVLPYKAGTYGGTEMDSRESILLCQKAYFNIAVVRNIIDLMTEFSVGEIFLQGGNKISRDFFQAWMNKINLLNFQDRFFREYYRSGNVFIYRFDGDVQPEDVRKIISLFGLQSKALVEISPPKLKLPARYIILNPADILYAGNICFSNGAYFKKLSDYEIMRLRNPKTDEDKEVLNSFSPEIRKEIVKRGMGMVNFPLTEDRVAAIFYKKQDYEPFACPMVYPVLEDLNAKIELKRIDMAIARTAQQIILLVTTGTEPEKGGINQANIIVLQNLFKSETVSRTLVADYTTKAEFVVPNISNILTEDKYAELDRDINIGLNNILWGEEKFANQATKIDVFLGRLWNGREIFLNEFLIPEIRRISKSLGFKNYPEPYYEDISLKNNDLRDRIYLRLVELGILTPEEVMSALESGRLPDNQSSIDNQKNYKQLRDSGYYLPLIGGAKPQDAQGGRPAAESQGVPQSTKKITPIGKGSDQFSIKSLLKYMKSASDLSQDVIKQLKKQFNKKRLSEAQLVIASDISKVIVANEEPENWKQKVPLYCKKPIDTNPQRINEINELASKFGIEMYPASLLYLCRISDKLEALENDQ